MPRFRSILSRIIWLHAIVLAAAGIALPLATYALLSTTTESYEDQTLRAHAATITKYIGVGRDGQLELNLPSDLRAFYDHGFDGFAYAIVDTRGRTLFSSLQGRAAIYSGAVPQNGPLYFQRARGRAIYYGANLAQHTAGHTFYVQVAQDLEHPDVVFDDIVAKFLQKVVWFTLPIILAVILIDIAVVRRALRPVLRASDEAHSIDPNRIDLRLSVRNVPAEIRPLVEAFNTALARLEAGFRTQREFAANAAHELRTPLAVLRSRIDAVQNESTAKALKQDIEVMARIVSQLLEVAELEGGVANLDEVLDLGSVCHKAADYIRPIAARTGQRVELTGTTRPVLVRGDADMLFRAVRNLAENASKYSPAGTTIEIRVEDTGSVCVIDEGPGVPDEDRALIFTRFWRRDRSRSDGAGLGLSIVTGIVAAHGGRVTVENGRKLGSIFVIHLTPLSLEPGDSGSDGLASSIAADPEPAMHVEI